MFIFKEEVLEEAATYIRDNEKIPDEVLEKAIGKKPRACSSAFLDTMMEEMQERAAYRQKLSDFLDQAVAAAG